MRASVLAAVALLSTNALSAQDSSAPARRWSIAVRAGSVHGGPVASAKRSLPGMGWGDTSPGGCFFIFCSDPTDYPKAYAGNVMELSVRYELSHRWALSAGTTGELLLGDVTGYRQGAFYGDYVYGHFEGSSRWVAAHMKAAEQLSGGLGVGLHHVHNRDEDPFREPSSHHRLGLVGEADLRLPGRSRIFWQLTARGHWIPGTVRFTESSSVDGQPIVFESSLSYGTISTGIGVRF
jgi:hypothetical protein